MCVLKPGKWTSRTCPDSPDRVLTESWQSPDRVLTESWQMKIRPDCKFLQNFRRRSAPADFEINSTKLVDGTWPKGPWIKVKAVCERLLGLPQATAHRVTDHTVYNAHKRSTQLASEWLQVLRKCGQKEFYARALPRTTLGGANIIRLYDCASDHSGVLPPVDGRLQRRAQIPARLQQKLGEGRRVDEDLPPRTSRWAPSYGRRGCSGLVAPAGYPRTAATRPPARAPNEARSA